ncbi:MAG: hypothetical protein WDO68_30830 [Gammaproteobacteria bacterium]
MLADHSESMRFVHKHPPIVLGQYRGIVRQRRNAAGRRKCAVGDQQRTMCGRHALLQERAQGFEIAVSEGEDRLPGQFRGVVEAVVRQLIDHDQVAWPLEAGQPDHPDQVSGREVDAGLGSARLRGRTLDGIKGWIRATVTGRQLSSEGDVLRERSRDSAPNLGHAGQGKVPGTVEIDVVAAIDCESGRDGATYRLASENFAKGHDSSSLNSVEATVSPGTRRRSTDSARYRWRRHV